MKKSRKALLILILIIPLLLISLNLPYSRGIIPTLSGMMEVKNEVFVGDNMSQDSIILFLNVLDSAIDKNNDFWNEKRNTPKILYCHSYDLIKKFNPHGDRNHAISIFTPIGYHMVINDTGVEVNILSHELLHCLFYEKLGSLKWLKLTYKIPVWFDEGLAMQVDHRELFSEDKIDNNRLIKDLRPIHHSKDFFIEESLWINYVSSKYEVKRWLSIVGSEGLIELINSINIKTNFYTEYSRIEKKATNNH